MPDAYPIEIVEIETFIKQCRGLLTRAEINGLKVHLAKNPEEGDVIPASNGLRKIRWGMKNRGKRRGGRVIYYYRDLNMPLYLLAIYSKSQKVDLTSAEKKGLSTAVEELVNAHCEKMSEETSKIKLINGT